MFFKFQKKRIDFYMPATEAGLRAQKKYNEKRKKLAAEVPLEKYEEIKAHAARKGFSSINSYVLDLINKDLQG